MATKSNCHFLTIQKKLKLFFALTTETIKSLDYDQGLNRSTEKSWPIEMVTKIYSPFFHKPKNLTFFLHWRPNLGHWTMIKV